jgi:hypothetical protein
LKHPKNTYQPHELFNLIAKRIKTLCGQALRTARISSQSVCRCQDANLDCLVPLYVNDKKIPIEVPREEWQDEGSLLIRLNTVRSPDQRFDFEDLNRLDGGRQSRITSPLLNLKPCPEVGAAIFSGSMFPSELTVQ